MQTQVVKTAHIQGNERTLRLTKISEQVTNLKNIGKGKKIIDLFAGIGGIRLGFERCDWIVDVWSCDILSI